MPFIFRDPTTGAIVKVSGRQVPGAEFVPHAHQELVDFMLARGADLGRIKDALDELRRTDLDMSRAVEDVITALMKKNILKMNDLPKAVQERIELRTRMRVLIAETYDRASSAKPLAS